MIKTILLTAFAPILGAFGGGYGSKLSNIDFFSKDYTTILKGICCLVVIYVHVLPDYTNALQDAIGSFAYVGVTLFFLFSSYGMMISVEQKNNYLTNFWRNRLVSLLIPCLLINVVSVIFSFLKGSGSFALLYRLNGYVAVLLQFCLWFYVVMICKNKWFKGHDKLGDWLLIIGVVISSLYLYFFVDSTVSAIAGWCFERIGLVWGILIYRYFDGFVKWTKKRKYIKSVILCMFCCLFGVMYLKYKMVWFWGAYLLKVLLGLLIIVFLFTMTSNLKLGNKVGLWIGNISYEVYLSHGLVMSVLAFYCKNINSGEFIFLTVCLTLVLSTIINKIATPLVKIFRK